ncbi:MAG: tetratricopeptide repeat protein, partial [Rubrivivax sp.]
MAQTAKGPHRSSTNEGTAARTGARLVLCGMLGLPFAVTAPTALAQPASTAAASTPAKPGAQAPSVDLAAVKAAIASDDRGRPVASIALAQQALAAGALKPEDRTWLRTRLVRDLIRVKRTDDALAQAVLGQQNASEERERLHFDRLQMSAWTEAGNPAEVLKVYQRIEARLPALGGDNADAASRLVAADAWRLAGMAMSRLGRLPEAAELLTRALRILDERPDAVYEFAHALTAMALVHSRSGRVDEALRSVQKAIDISQAAGDRSSLSNFFLRKSHFLGMLGRPDEQYEALLKARASAQEEQNHYNLAVAATNLADVALQKKDYHRALSHAEEAIPLVERTGDKESLWVCWVNKGTALNRLGRPGGIDWIRKAVAAFTATPGMATSAAEFQGVLAEELAFTHDYPQAYEAAMQFNRLTGEVRKAADQKRIADANAAYEADRRQRQIDALEQEHRHQQRFRWMLALAAAAGLIAAVVAVVSRYHVKRAYRAMRDMAFSDPLTGLRNRRHLVSTIH